jgi:serine/threonine-protein kinase
MADNLIGDRYVLGPLLGRGGMAEVRRARDTRLERDVAVKRLKADLAGDPVFQERFRREAHSAAGLNHPNIVSVFDTGESFDQASGLMIPYIVMELVTGHTLREILRDGRKIQPVKALEITGAVLDALEYSHRHGIIHRDIKPANVMLTPSGQVKVMDFGIARAMSDATASMTQTASVIGTPQYLSPEQIRGETVDRRADLYAAGCLLYELLTSRPPFEGDSPVALAYQHVRSTPVPPSEVDPLVSTQMDAVVLKALAKNPAERYQSAQEMREDIARLLAGQKVAAVIPPPVADDPTQVMSAAGHTQVMAPSDSTQVMAAADRTQVMPTRGQPVASRLANRAVEEAEPPSTLGRTIGIIIAVIAVIAAGTAGVVWALTRDPGPSEVVPTTPTVSAPQLVSVPDVETLKQDEAVRLITNQQLVPDVQTYRGPDDDTVGTVTEQNPKADDEVPVGSKVTLRVNQGPETFEVINVVGQKNDVAKGMLEQTFSNVTVQPAKTEGPNDQVGVILSQDPPAGSMVAKDTPIILYEATGMTELPTLFGFTETAATLELGRRGFTDVTTEPSESTQPPNTVIDMNPKPGTVVSRGSPITLIIAIPVPEETVPPPSTEEPTDPTTEDPGDEPTG